MAVIETPIERQRSAMPEKPRSEPRLSPSDPFVRRHIGPSEDDVRAMLETIGCPSLDALMDETIPPSIRSTRPLELGPPRGEHELLAELREIASRNQVFRSMIGMGYYDCITPPVILRNILENPAWYTQYTPYQAEIAQGRLEALLNFQTMVADLTALPVANASLLDEATAAAEAMTMCRAIRGDEKRSAFLVADDCHSQTIAVVQTRAKPLGIDLHVGSTDEIDFDKQGLFGVLLQYPTTDGRICDYTEIIERAHAAGALVVMATDLLALTLIKPPGEFGADVAIGSAQRFGVPMGLGGPHAAFISTRDEFKRQLPGRIVGVSKDAQGDPAYRLSIQTREQHIRREKATSNICTAQVLLAIMASMYAVYHGPAGLREIAWRVHTLAALLERGMETLGFRVGTDFFFDTIRVRTTPEQAEQVRRRALAERTNLHYYDDGSISVALDETTTEEDVETLWRVFSGKKRLPLSANEDAVVWSAEYGFDALRRNSPYLAHPVFNQYHSETELLRYMYRLQQRDLSLATSMIPLGSCTMKLNATTEMIPITWPQFASMHPFAPADQWRGYAELFERLESQLAEITGFPAISLQPNAGAQGEYTGLLVIRAYHESRGEGHRRICLIPTSAHGTNPASAIMAGMKVVPVACDDHGNIDVADLKDKAEQRREDLAALMITYPSTHGVFEEAVREICQAVHAAGGQVYMDGANLNAQVGLCRPAEIGADVCHLNLHKTFCIPHGGGGPGMGPIGVAKHLVPFLPGHVARPPPAGPEPIARPPSAGSATPAKPAGAAHRRYLPHLLREGRPVFLTFCTEKRWVLPHQVRRQVLDHCVHDHGVKIFVHAAVVMPDHVHLVFTPLADTSGNPYGLPEIMNGIKGASAHGINKALGRKGRVWQPEYFDRLLRRDEDFAQKVEYVLRNPERKNLADDLDEYPWIWREWVEGADPAEDGRVTGSAEGGRVTGPAEGGWATRPAEGGRATDRPRAAGLHIGPVAAAPYGSPSILPISHAYISLMGGEGLTRATQVAILSANYMAKRLEAHYPILYTGKTGRVAHEFILDVRELKKTADITVDDIAKRLMDYGFHAPTMSWPVPGTLMIEPTESESKAELDRFCEAMIGIRQEIRAIEEGRADRVDNVLKGAPHTTGAVASDDWTHPYTRQQAAFPLPWVRTHKFWPAVGRIDNVWGDRHLACTCPPMAAFEADSDAGRS